MESTIITGLANMGALGLFAAALFYLLLHERRQCNEEHRAMMAVLERHTIILERIAERLHVGTPEGGKKS